MYSARWLLLAFAVMAGCSQQQTPDYRDEVAIDAALCTLEATPAPEPAQCATCGGTGYITHGDGHKTLCPDCSEGSLPQAGPIRSAKELIEKGNKIADGVQAILDGARQQGHINVKIEIPPQAVGACLEDRDSIAISQPAQQPKTTDDSRQSISGDMGDQPARSATTERQSCAGGSCGYDNGGWYPGKMFGRRR